MKTITEVLSTIGNDSFLGVIKFEILCEGKVGIIAQYGHENAVKAFFSRNGYDILDISAYKKRNPLSNTAASFALTGNIF